MELQRHSKFTEDPRRPAKTMERSSPQDSSNLGHIKLELEDEGGEVQISPPKLSRPPVPSPAGALLQGLNRLPGLSKQAHIHVGTTGMEQGETSRLERCVLIDSQGLPSTVLVEEGVGSAEATAGGTEGGGSGGSSHKVYCCPVCSRTFEYLSYLQRHSITHSENKPHRCRTCGKAFKRASHLERHKYTHSGRKPYECPICHRSFRDSGELFHHQWLHTGSWPYKCEACHMRFVERNTLQRHVLRKHRLQLPPTP
ncbi:PREDICTED: zinc finger protein 581-like [Gekko japonicus]|uniref:Zinc finger protein 581-like n=1 Tax=Gekko japonicus TaxID=146911 RepID=A0ABM1K1G9_GEKJA|nr:PREDICTED: zinc finger protein 581-like [Gekko japonicus]